MTGRELELIERRPPPQDGPVEMLSGLVRRIAPDAATASAATPAEVEAVLKGL